MKIYFNEAAQMCHYDISGSNITGIIKSGINILVQGESILKEKILYPMVKLKYTAESQKIEITETSHFLDLNTARLQKTPAILSAVIQNKHYTGVVYEHIEYFVPEKLETVLKNASMENLLDEFIKIPLVETAEVSTYGYYRKSELAAGSVFISDVDITTIFLPQATLYSPTISTEILKDFYRSRVPAVISDNLISGMFCYNPGYKPPFAMHAQKVNNLALYFSNFATNGLNILHPFASTQADLVSTMCILEILPDDEENTISYLGCSLGQIDAAIHTPKSGDHVFWGDYSFPIRTDAMRDFFNQYIATPTEAISIYNKTLNATGSLYLPPEKLKSILHVEKTPNKTYAYVSDKLSFELVSPEILKEKQAYTNSAKVPCPSGLALDKENNIVH